MKKLLVVLSILLLSGCGSENLEVIEASSWPTSIPRCDCGNEIKANTNKTKLVITEVTEEEKNAYFDIIREEYNGVLTDTDTYYQAYNSESKNIIVEYKDNELTITQK